MGTEQELLTLNGKKYLLDIEQAKKLNLLKEKDTRVKSWEEFVEKYNHRASYWVSPVDGIINATCSPGIVLNARQLTQQEAVAINAFSKLLKLRRDWIGEWEPDWEDMNTSYGVIWANKNEAKSNTACTLSWPLSFPDYKMAKEFLETFRDLIEEAKTLI